MIYTFQGFRLDPGGRRLLSADGEPIPLTSRVFDTLLYLVTHRGELLDKDTLMQAVWPDTVVEENRLNQVISALRKALGERPGEHRFILTEPGRGYRFVAEVQELDQQPDLVPPITTTHESSRRSLRVYFGLLVLIAAAGIGYFYLNFSSYYVIPKQSQETARTQATPSVTSKMAVKVTPPPSVAVLPFVNMSPDKDQEYFAEGVAEQVQNQLSRIRDLFVIGPESSFSFKGEHEDLRAIGEKLGASYLLKGSVRKDGQRVRITTQLVKAKDGHNLWSRSYDRDLEDIFAIQDDIAKSVADALQITLGVGELGREPGMTHNIAAYDAYITGYSMYFRLGRENFSRAIEQLKKATAMDPNFANAWNILAQVYESAATVFITERADKYFPKAKSAAERAIAISPGSIGGLYSDVLLQRRYRNWRAAETDYKKTLRLMPFYAGTNYTYGSFLDSIGRPHDAIEYLQRAVRLEPLSIVYAMHLGISYEFSSNYKAALKVYKSAKGLKGDHALLNFQLSVLAMETGDRDMLDTVLENMIHDEILPPDNRSLTGTMRSLLDTPEQARAELNRLYNDPKYNNYSTRVFMAHWASYFKDPQLALKIYTEISKSSPEAIQILWRPLQKNMRRLPGFKDLVRTLRLVDYWRKSGNWGEFCRPVGENDFECM